MSAAATARPRLLRRPVSDAQRQASRHNSTKSCGPRTPTGKAHTSRNARKHGLYAKIHQFTPEEAEALRDRTQYFIEASQLTDPLALTLVRQLALARFQMDRINRMEAEIWANHPGDFITIALLTGSLSPVYHRYSRILFRCCVRLHDLEMENERNKPGNSLKTNDNQTSAGSPFRPLFSAAVGQVGQALPPATPRHPSDQNKANKPKNSLKPNVQPTQSGKAIRLFFAPRPAPPGPPGQPATPTPRHPLPHTVTRPAMLLSLHGYET